MVENAGIVQDRRRFDVGRAYPPLPADLSAGMSPEAHRRLIVATLTRNATATSLGVRNLGLLAGTIH